MRTTAWQTDTVAGSGYGNPVKPVGLICSVFRPSDDATTFLFLIPSNHFAVVSLNQLSEIFSKVIGDYEFANQCSSLADEVKKALNKYGITEHHEFGNVFPYEVDGFGNKIFMDDANIPSLLSLPYFGCFDLNDSIYRNTRRLILSESNPYFFKGKAGEGIGGPHAGINMIWHLGIIMRALTSSDEMEIKTCLRMLKSTHAGTGFMHESFHKDDASKFTRKWFAWANTLFGELILKIHKERPHLLG
jgi:meiotically up-regulated gene 157 (Mug157) protein